MSLSASPPSREHVFHLTIPKDWKNNNIFQIFRLYGNVRISWVDDTSCFVALHNRENATGLLKTIGNHEGVTIISFADFKKRESVSNMLIGWKLVWIYWSENVIVHKAMQVFVTNETFRKW